MDRITGVLSSIPGYDGYRDKENRREIDQRVRAQIGDLIGQFALQIERVGTTLADRREIMAVGPVDSAAKAVRHLQDLVLTTSYGYGGLYSDKNIDQLALDQLIQFDTDLLTLVKGLGPAVDELQAATDDAGRGLAISEILETIGGLRTRFDERVYVIETGRPSAPSTPTSPLTVLEPEKTKPLPPVAFNLKIGDALSILGANYLVDATIAVEGDQPMRLARIDVAPERWLVVNQRFAADTTRQDLTVGAGSAVVNGEALPLHGSGSGLARVTGLGGASDKQQMRYQVYGGASEGGATAFVLSWAAQSLTLVGRGLAADDIEIFGQPAGR